VKAVLAHVVATLRSSAEKRAGPKTFIIEVVMSKISLNLPEHPSSSPADLPRMDRVDNHILRDCTEHEKTLTAQIEMAVDEADRGRFASTDLVAAMRARRWGTNVP
jgi:hypothetical protein